MKLSARRFGKYGIAPWSPKLTRAAAADVSCLGCVGVEAPPSAPSASASVSLPAARDQHYLTSHRAAESTVSSVRRDDYCRVQNASAAAFG